MTMSVPRTTSSQLIESRDKLAEKSIQLDCDPATGTTSASDTRIASLLEEMDRLVSLDRILDARKVVDTIKAMEALPGVSSDRIILRSDREKMSGIIDESNHITSLLRDLQSDDNWTLATSRRGVTVHYRNEDGSPIHSVKTHAILDNFDSRDFVRLCSLFLESDLSHLWFPRGIIDGCSVLAEPSKYRQVLHMNMSFGRFSPLSPRDAVVEGRGYHLADENALLVLSTSVEQSPHCPIPQPPKGCIRIDLSTAFYIQLLPGHRALFRQISHDDPKIRFLPSSILNFLAQGTIPFEIVQSIRSVLIDYDESVWDGRMKQRKDFYRDIEDRVNNELLSNDYLGENSNKPQYNISGSRTESTPRSRIDKDRMEEAAIKMGGHMSGEAYNPTLAESLWGVLWTVMACLFCMFVARLLVQLSVCFAQIPWYAQLVSVACTIMLMVFLAFFQPACGEPFSAGTTVKLSRKPSRARTATMPLTSDSSLCKTANLDLESESKVLAPPDASPKQSKINKRNSADYGARTTRKRRGLKKYTFVALHTVKRKLWGRQKQS